MILKSNRRRRILVENDLAFGVFFLRFLFTFVGYQYYQFIVFKRDDYIFFMEFVIIY